MALNGGTLVRNDQSGLGFDHGGSVEPVIWPYGYTMALADGRAVLIDPNGTQVAREGDVVTATGGGGYPFEACRDVSLVEAAATGH
jgi:hypothetical protein